MLRADIAQSRTAMRRPYLALLGALVATLSALSLGLSIYSGLTIAPYENTGYFIVDAVLIPLAVPAFGAVGLLITWKHPRHWVGWICLGLAAMIGVQLVVWQSVLQASNDGVAPLWFAWLANLLDPEFIFPPFALLLLLFPTGRLLSRRWRAVIWSVVIVTLTGHLTSGFGSEIFIDRGTRIDNPYTLPALARLADAAEPILVALSGAMLLTSIASLNLRWRRSTGVDRQQLKWLAYVGGFLIVTTLAMGLSAAVYGLTSHTIALSILVVTGISIGIPAATGIAILRYGLFDIDRLINRTLVYAVVMAILAGVYGASILSLQTVMGSLAGSSGVAVAASTLAAVALFQPMRVRVQSWVNRRFYRARYNASLALTEFGQSVRDEVDLERLQLSLCRLLTETVQPQRVAFWIAESENRLSTGGSVRRAD